MLKPSQKNNVHLSKQSDQNNELSGHSEFFVALFVRHVTAAAKWAGLPSKKCP